MVERFSRRLTFLSLWRREALSVAGDIYRHKLVKAHRHSPDEVALPKSIWDGLLPLIFKDLKSEWSEGLSAVGASELGSGMTWAPLSSQDAGRLGGVAERSRFREAILNPRANAFGSLSYLGEVADSRGSRMTRRRRASMSSRMIPVFRLRMLFEDVGRMWTTTGMHRWRRPLTLPVAEARAALYAVKDSLRARGALARSMSF